MLDAATTTTRRGEARDVGLVRLGLGSVGTATMRALQGHREPRRGTPTGGGEEREMERDRERERERKKEKMEIGEKEMRDGRRERRSQRSDCTALHC